MATVYLAHDLQHDRPVALKVVLPELAAAIGTERFQQEVRLAARLQHPHILGVYDSGEAAGQLWFTMPYVEGESLRDRLTRETQLPVEEAARIVREAALALDYAHRHGVIHRDIKPENILLSDGQALVADFGIARALGGERSLTATGVTVGTPAYMSPEQASGERTLDARTDVYALGCVLYELLAGEPPFSGPSAQAVMARVMTETPRPLTAVRPAVSPALAAAVAKAMAKTPADRFASAADLAKAISITSGDQFASAAEVARAPTLASGAVAAGGRSPRQAFRRMGPVAIGLAALVVVLAGGLGIWRATHGGDNARRIAVLPFENEGAAEDDYFADGVTDEVRSKLAGIPGLQVTARSSAGQYRHSTKNPRQIGKELEVEYLLTGTVRWSKVAGGRSRVRVNPELIQVSTSASTWSDAIDADISDVFTVQSDIAGKVASALDLALGAGERQRLAERPTRSLDAYDAYLKGEQMTQGMGIMEVSLLKEALVHYQRAATLDTTFAQAWAAIALAECEINRATRTEDGVARAKDAAERALRLAASRPEGRLAMGTYLRVLAKDYSGALEQFQAGLRADRNNAALLTAAAGAERSLGRWDEALSHLEQAQRIDPRSISTARALAYIYHDMRRYPQALAAADVALALSPNNLAVVQQKATTWLSLGHLDSARAVVHQALSTGADTTAVIARFALYQEMMWALDPALWPKLVALRPENFNGDRGHWGLKVGGTWKLLGDTARARAYGDSALADFQARLEKFPEEAQLQELVGRALALGGHRAEAIVAAERSLKMRETSLDASTGPYVRYQVARILIQAGSYERALELIEPLLSSPSSDLTPAWLRLEPIFKPLRGNPRFERLIAAK